MDYPQIKNPDLVGTYPALVFSGGGYVWDEVLEYRVWCHSALDIENVEDGNDYYCAFESYNEALIFSEENQTRDKPIALVLQEEYISEPEPGNYVHIKQQRITEWGVDFLSRPRRMSNTIPDFFSSNAPANRLDILRGLV